jgi:hypothetical protein
MRILTTPPRPVPPHHDSQPSSASDVMRMPAPSLSPGGGRSGTSPTPPPSASFLLDAKAFGVPPSSDRESIAVVVRCRPFIKNEAVERCVLLMCSFLSSGFVLFSVLKCVYVFGCVLLCVSSKERAVQMFPTSTSVLVAGKKHDFAFDTCYGEDSLQSDVYAHVARPIVGSALEGFNGTIFAYGQTSSGKSHTMMGTQTPRTSFPLPLLFYFWLIFIHSDFAQKIGVLEPDGSIGPQTGIIPRMVQHVFEHVQYFTVNALSLCSALLCCFYRSHISLLWNARSARE